MLQNNFEYFVGTDQVPKWKRLLYFFLALAVLYFGHDIVNPWLRHLIRPFFAAFDTNQKLFFGHLLWFSLGGAFVTYLFILVSVKLQIIKPVSFVRSPGHAVAYGFMGGGFICAFMILLWILTGRHFQLEINWYSICGNLFSNFYEEVEYRALLIPASLYLFRNKWAAFSISAVIMAAAHYDYPLQLQVCVGTASFITAVIYFETGNLLAPWISHQLSDVVLDAILVL